MKKSLFAIALFFAAGLAASCEKEAEVKPDLKLEKTMGGDKNNCGTWDLRQDDTNP